MTDLRAPFVKAALEAVDDIGQRHSGDGENCNTDEDFVGLERGSRNRDHEADTGGGGIEFADHDADERATDGESKARENEGNRGGQHDRLENLPFRRAETSRRGEQVRRRSFDAVPGVDQEWKNRAQKNDPHLGKDADTQPNDDERQKGDAWRGVHRVDERVADVRKPLIPADRNAERNSENDREEITPGKLYPAYI